MGAWGFRSFENDEALDWVAELEESPSLTPVRRALRRARWNFTGFGISGTAECGIAAAEVVAAMRGRPAADLPEGLREWTSRTPVDSRTLKGLVSRAKYVCKKVVKDKAIRSRFFEEKDVAEWQAVVHELILRLEG
jgi:hypothetical protein